MAEIDDRVRELEAWTREHDGRINAYWESQHKLNDQVELRFESAGRRLGALERKVMWLSGVAAALGAMLGNVIASYSPVLGGG